MIDQLWLEAALLGIVEGLTEFIPVSSTGHMILIGDLIGFDGPPGRVFEVAIQLGAILAVCVAYARTLLRVVVTAPTDPAVRRFILAILLAFLPAAVIGAFAHGFIKSVLFSPWVVAVSLILGGIAILAIERTRPTPRHTSIATFTPRLALGIGLCQCLAMVPGVSRSGATIMGALVLGVERRTAAEFSFFLAIPTMFGATAYDLYKNRDTLTLDGAGLIAIGFVLAFVAALLVVRSLVAYVGRHGFAPFACYRIIVGTVMLALLAWR
ncbi:undecaprenyl-diphosphate phosphatase [Limobrevibacterium gyesilva]|uniref:Undecaprenyl-diphosphatase n=1 Tax=Limobrevibacterium gyesilva TaxID=2991712 RepID=A0AA42CER2_9PROT|nr:undecaprenyl-diphosphate phosphatase [Limobrevibacterium gyesilva]MCW3475609.1 undecaprenyl-diphosphate phosphatase [Limobrevibacterium gyesilva]